MHVNISFLFLCLMQQYCGYLVVHICRKKKVGLLSEMISLIVLFLEQCQNWEPHKLSRCLGFTETLRGIMECVPSAL